MFSLRGQQKKWLLWLLALAVLCFLVSLHPELRKHLWFQAEEPPARDG
jgi:hypothetical protein